MKPVTERHVQAIWYDAAFRPGNLVTRRGSEVRVVSPGEWNLEAGPDFLNAVLEIGPDRRRLAGDVEVHLAPSDWELHRHGEDPAYRNVIAHVTWGCGPVPASLPAGAVSIWLGRFVASEPTFTPEQIDLSAYPYARLPAGARLCEEEIGGDPVLARRILAAAGRDRLCLKARRILGRLVASAGDRKQVFYEEVMTALGYKKNEGPFRRVARRVPIAELTRDVATAKAMLLAAGGFEEWDRTGYRPSNTPETRLASAAEIFLETPVMAMSENSDFSAASCRRLVKEMCGGHRMGRGRAAAVLANVVLPFALAEARVATIPDWLPPEDLSSPVRLTAFRLFGRDHNPAALYASNGLLIQGLLEIHRTCCLQSHPDCSACELLSELRHNLAANGFSSCMKTLQSV